MESLTTTGLIAFCHKDDELLKDFLIQNKIKGRAFEVMTELEFPTPIRVQVRLLRKAIDLAILKGKNHKPEFNICFDLGDYSDKPADNTPHVLPTDKTPHVLPTDTTAPLIDNLPEEFNEILKNENESESLVNLLNNGDAFDHISLPNHLRSDTFLNSPSSAQRQETTSRVTTPQSLRKQRHAQLSQYYSSWPRVFVFPENKLSEKLKNKLTRHDYYLKKKEFAVIYNLLAAEIKSFNL